MIKKIILLLLVISSTYSKVLIKEYIYSASEYDSKITARQKALKEVKKLAIEEVGIYINSELNYTKSLKNGQIKRKIESNIQTISSAITKTKILKESWNGEKYYIKVEIVINDKKIDHTIKKIKDKKIPTKKVLTNGLTWEKKSLKNRNIEYNFNEAVEYCKNLKQNWRLPTKDELINGDIDKKNISDLGIYWSSTKANSKIILISIYGNREFYYYPKGYFSVICVND